MGQERDVIVTRWIDHPSLLIQKRTRILDLSELEIGDHFMVNGRATLGWFRRQIAADKSARGMEFRQEKVTPHRLRFTRTA